MLTELGGDGSRVGIRVINDTGSSVLTILNTDLMYLGNLQAYYGWSGDVFVTVANGNVERLHSLWVEIRFLVPETLEPWGPWILEQAVIRVDAIDRLSGSGMRQHLFFGTSPLNAHVAVATTKYGMTSII